MASDQPLNLEASARQVVIALERQLGDHQLADYPEDVPVTLRTAFRALRAARLVDEVATNDGGGDEEPALQYVEDILSDLMHLVSLTDLNFDDVLQAAERMFNSEKSEDQ